MMMIVHDALPIGADVPLTPEELGLEPEDLK